MSIYVDGSLISVPKKNVEAYRRMSARAGKIWKRYGALAYRECVADDLKVKRPRVPGDRGSLIPRRLTT